MDTQASYRPGRRHSIPAPGDAALINGHSGGMANDEQTSAPAPGDAALINGHSADEVARYAGPPPHRATPP